MYTLKPYFKPYLTFCISISTTIGHYEIFIRHYEILVERRLNILFIFKSMEQI